METIGLMKENLKHDLEVYVLITIADVRTNLYREVVEEIKIFWRSSFETVIHRNISLAEATSHGCRLWNMNLLLLELSVT